jgi:hypothetical protein
MRFMTPRLPTCARANFTSGPFSQFAETDTNLLSGQSCRPLAPAGRAGHTRGVSQEYDDYADHDSPRAGLPPALVRLLFAVVLMLALFGFCLLISVQIDVD